MLAAELGVVQSLVEQSLLRRAGDRFWMLETIREFALERLGGLPGREELLAAHAAFALGVAQKAGQRLEGAEAPAAARGVDIEHDNLRAAMEWAYASGHAALGVEIAALLERQLEESLQIARDLEDAVWIGWNLVLLGLIARLRGDLVRAWELSREALGLSRQRNDPLQVLGGIAELAAVASRRGDRRSAALLWGAAERLDAELGPSLFAAERDQLEAELGKRDTDFERGVAEGRSRAPDDVLASALLDA